MKLRDSVVWVHRWLALVAGVFWGIAALTGGVLVFEYEIERWLNGGRFEVTAGDLAPGSLDGTLAANFPGETVRSMAWLREDHVFRITMEGADGQRRVFVDAGTGREVENMRPRRELVGLVRRAHSSLFAGQPGFWLIMFASAAAVLSMLTGLYLWWPGIRSFARGLAVRTRRGAYILNFDLHQVLGALAFVLLFVMTATGVIMGIPGASAGIARTLFPPDPPAPAAETLAPPRATEGPPGIEELASIGEAAGGGRVASLAFLEGEPARVEVRVRPEGGAASDGVRVLLAREDGRILDVFDRSRWSREQRFDNIVERWHTAAFPSLLVRTLFAAACFMGAVVMATGFVIWWVKRSRKMEAAERREAAVPG